MTDDKDILSEDENIDNYIVLTDDEGKEHNFQQLDYYTENENEYVALVPVLDNPADVEEYDGELVIMKVIKNKDGEMLYFIEDDSEFNKIAEVFMERLSEDYDFDEFEPNIEVIE
ncbi:MAG: DUF1292 domain-containing protein [Oscillospiraceae bacterium]